MSSQQNAAEPLVNLNRRVRVRGRTDRVRDLRSVDDLRSFPFVVIFGEPGIGKSSILAREAAREGVRVVTVRGLMEGEKPDTNRRLFIDALDEYRSGEDRGTKTSEVVKLVRELGVGEIWLGCRTEDWRPQVDDAKFPRAASVSDAVMAEVLPLAWGEAAALLAAWGEADAEGFLRTAWNLGASSFTENPLSLRLLHKAVGPEARWPSTRFAVFDEGIGNLSKEHDPEREVRHRPLETEIRAAAATACLILLLTGARAIWKPGVPAVGVADHLTPADLGLPADLLSWVRDTPLFRGAGSSFLTLRDAVRVAMRELSKSEFLTACIVTAEAAYQGDEIVELFQRGGIAPRRFALV